MLSASQLIWASCRPLIRLVICVGFGFGITKADIFPQEAARGVGQIILTITMPCLMFSKIVPSFNSDNISALGPLFLVAFLYGILGIASAWILRQFFWVPHRFRNGILVAGGWGNYGDIPTAVVMSICGSAPFNGVEDQTRAVAYVSAFILVFLVTLFPMGGSRLIARDFVGPDIEDDEVRSATQQRRRALLSGSLFVHDLPSALRKCTNSLRRRTRQELDVEEAATRDEKIDEKDEKDAADTPILPRSPALGRHVSFFDAPESQAPTAVCSPVPTERGISRRASPEPTETHVEPETRRGSPAPVRHRATRSTRILRGALAFTRELCTPASLSIFVGLLISLVPPVKALFISPPSPHNLASYHISAAPDGEPPLAVLLDTANFVGAASVPLGLVCLGGALARLKAPRGADGWARMPLGAIGALAVFKTLVMPVLGVLLCEGLTKAGVIDREDKVLRFVCIFFSCLPTATTQVFLTQVYSGTGDAEHLSSFLIPQYILMFISMTALTAYSLQLIF